MSSKISNRKSIATGLVILLFCTLTVSAYANENQVDNLPFSDIEKHWAKDMIINKYNQEIVKGYPTGEFKPDNHLTRAELITLINRHFGLTAESDDNYSDVKKKDWFKNEAAKAKYYDYIEENEIKGNKKATRLDVVNLLSSLMDIEKEDLNHSFNDIQGLTKEQQAALASFAGLGYINGYEDGSFRPDEPVKRAEMVSIADRILGYVVKNQEDVKNIPEGATVTIIGKNISLEGKTIKSLYISPGSTGNITIKDTKIEKEIKIAAEGKKSNITLDNINTQKVQVDPKSEGAKVIIKGKDSKIETIEVKSDTNIQGVEGDNIQVKNIIIRDSRANIHNIKNIDTRKSKKYKSKDSTPPVTGDNGSLITSDATITSIQLSWTKASDNRSAESDLQYQVYYALDDNIRSISAIEANGIPIENYDADISSKQITGLTANTTYYFNVIVKDSAGNKSAYTSISGSTLKAPDTLSPTLSDSSLYPDNSISFDSIRIRWTKAADNETAQEDLEYRVYYSQSHIIRTVGAIEQYGTPAGIYETDIQEKTVTGLSPNTNYLLNVIVKDEAGNKTAYSCIMGMTSQMMDMQQPLF